jgi:hypothetical protein
MFERTHYALRITHYALRITHYAFRMQILLVLSGLAVAVGGVMMLYRASRRADTTARGPYVPLAVIAIGLMIAYRAYSDFRRFDAVDYVIMSLFVVAMLSILGVQFFIVDRHKRDE